MKKIPQAPGKKSSRAKKHDDAVEDKKLINQVLKEKGLKKGGRARKCGC